MFNDFMGNRIKPEEVVAAYQKVGCRPQQSVYVHYDKDVQCACAIGALYLASGHHEEYSISKDAQGVVAVNWSEERYGSDYKRRFTQGFDGSQGWIREDLPANWTEQEKDWYFDGVAVWQAVEKMEGANGL